MDINPKVECRIIAKVDFKDQVREWDKGSTHYTKLEVILSDNSGTKIEGMSWGE